MNYNDFLNGVIDGGIEGAKRSYSNPNNASHPMMLEGAIAGFEACRGKSPEELGLLLGEAGTNTTRAMLEQLPDYWRHRCFHSEIEWVCNCVSAMLMNEGLPTIITPTCRGVLRANEVMRERTETA